MNSYLSRLRTILAQEPHPIRFLISRILMRTAWSHHLPIRRDGYALKFFPTALSAAMWANAEFRTDEERFIRAILREGDSVIDVGANIGSIALASACAVGLNGQVLAVEPHPKVFNYLAKNIAFNGARQIKAIQCALGHEVGTVRLTDRRSDDQNAIASGGAIEVPLNRLDDVSPKGRIRLLKVDVEGSEYFVFKGGEDTLRRTEIVYFEYVPKLMQNLVAEPWRPLIDLGFQIYEQNLGVLKLAVLPPLNETMLIAAKNADVSVKWSA